MTASSANYLLSADFICDCPALLLSLVPPRAALRPTVLALGLAATVPRFGHAEATCAFHAAPFAVRERVASAARRLLGSGGPAGRDGPRRAGHAATSR